ncbi:BtpA/SgcQ family protein [Actinomadura geliboluensis]|uniref:BtpA/SgcQ family protein n=1 Tax=Actinomadura geliboluensis TaxID=882440 RepID=UPI003724A946
MLAGGGEKTHTGGVGIFEAGGRKRLIGMVHVGPLPGTPFHRDGSFPRIRDGAVASAAALRAGGADGCLVQTNDRVYGRGEDCDPARLVAVGVITAAVIAEVGPDWPVGVQIMRNAVRASLGAAQVTGAQFVRVGALVGQTASPSGMVQSDPLAVAAYRRAIGAGGIEVVADVASMHYRWNGGHKTPGEVASLARNAGADAVAVGHRDTDTALRMLDSVRRCAPDLPVVLAGYTDHRNAAALLTQADGAFVGTCLQPDGWGGRIDPDLVRSYVRAAHADG